MSFWVSFLIVFLLILLNGLLAMAELAIVSARRSRLQQMAEEGDRGAQLALDLAEDPGSFLSTVQIGITLIGIITGAFSGATLSAPLAGLLAQAPGLANAAEPIAVTVTVLIVTYLSLVVGELVPKRLALEHAEPIAARTARPMHLLARLTHPLVWVLDQSSELLLKVMGVKPNAAPLVTEEEVRVLIEQGAQAGVFEPIEEEIMDQLFRLSDRRVSAIMTPRTEITWFDVHDSPDAILSKIAGSGHSRYPVGSGDLDHIVGVVTVKALLERSMTGGPLDLASLAQPALFLLENMPGLAIVERLRESQAHLALVIDEYGGVEGLVTFTDVMRAILGEVPDNQAEADPPVVQRDDGSWLVDGLLPVDDFQAEFEIKELPHAEEAPYQTLAGLIMTLLGRVAAVGNSVVCEGYRLEVVDMDGRRIDKVLVTQIPEAKGR